jgi:hypothetical protein
VRDKLLEEIAALDTAEGALAWAIRRIGVKNKLTAEDAFHVETAFQGRIRVLAPEAYNDTSSSALGAVPAQTGSQLQLAGSDSQLASAADAPHACESQNPGKRNGGRKSMEEEYLGSMKLRRSRDKDHLRFIAIQPCTVCGRRPCEAHHIRYTQPRALGRRVSDEFTVPLCRLHHRELHRQGDERAWWNKLSIDPMPIALRYWQHTRGIPKARRSDQERRDDAAGSAEQSRAQLAADSGLSSGPTQTGDRATP